MLLALIDAYSAHPAAVLKAALVIFLALFFVCCLLSAVRKDCAARAAEAEKRRRMEQRAAMLKQAAEKKALEEAAPQAEPAVPKRRPGRPRKNPVQADAPKRKPGRPKKTLAESPAPAPAAPPAAPAPETSAEALPQPPAYLNPLVNPAHPQTGRAQGNGAFAGQVVSFTGRLPQMTRTQAIEAVRLNGGRAFESMPHYTTLLVVGDRPGMTKLDHADEWIDHVRKITPAQFAAMLARPIPAKAD